MVSNGNVQFYTKPMPNNRRLWDSCRGELLLVYPRPYLSKIVSVSAVAFVRPLVGVTPDPDVTSHSHVGAWKWEGVGGQGVRDLQTGDNEPVYHFVIGGRATVVEPAGGDGEERPSREEEKVLSCALVGSLSRLPDRSSIIIGLLRQLCRKKRAEKGALLQNLRIIDLWFCFTFLHISAKFHLKPHSYVQMIII